MYVLLEAKISRDKLKKLNFIPDSLSEVSSSMLETKSIDDYYKTAVKLLDALMNSL